MRVAMITGASRGLGLALARALASRGWALVVDARRAEALEAAARDLRDGGARVIAPAGDVAEEDHRLALVRAAQSLGGLDVLVNNASVLGPVPLPRLERAPVEALPGVYAVNVFAPLRLIQLALPLLRARGGRIVNVTSDAAAEGYEGWGVYGSSKAALEHLSKVLATEHPELAVYALDPGDMDTEMHREAAPGDLGLPPPEASVPGLLRLIEGDLPSGRYLASELLQVEAAR